MLYLNFIWHMHQPYYRDDASHKTKMPWVFLHCIKDYYDIPYYLSHFPQIKATFNIVPSLIIQIYKYIDKSANDELLRIMQLRVDDFSKDDISVLEDYIFLSNEQNMIKPFWRYHELYLKFISHKNSIENFDKNEILDAQVLFLLAWCGNYLRENNTTVKSMISQGVNYTHEQKIGLINELIRFIATILPFYKQLKQKGQIEISTTPAYHPILPLLLDIKKGKEADPSINIPQTDLDFKDFAQIQVERAIEIFENEFGFKPNGFWPAEGSVSDEAIELIAKQGIKWVATDQDILFKTTHDYSKYNLCKKHIFKNDNANVCMFFRDKYVSDLIGFEYSRKDSTSAALDFIDNMRKIQVESFENRLISIILDGENAWEFFPNNAKNFFYELYKELEENKNWISTVLPSQTCGLDIKINEMKSIRPGSWINGNFNIWVGKPQKNKAWDLLFLTKSDYLANKDKLNKNTIEKITDEFLVALGSDWFWWYDDDHYTSQKVEFDDLFRTHLKNIYDLMGVEVPQLVKDPIVVSNEVIQSKFGSMHKTSNANVQPSEFRYCKLSKEWILFAPKRINRPNNFFKETFFNKDSTCPFDVGNEHMTPKEIARIPSTTGWHARVIPNLYNVLSIESKLEGKRDEFFDIFSGFGAHEVIIETPDHDKQVFNYSIDDFFHYLTLAKHRIISLSNDKRIDYVSLFKNSGDLAGASVNHSHSQIIALPFVPREVAGDIEYMKRYYQKYKRALLDDLVYEERKYEKDIVFENESFTCYAPYASKFAYEIKIVSKDKVASIVEMNDEMIYNLSKAMQVIFKKLYGILGEFGFNMMFKNHPYEGYTERSKKYYRFYIEICPRLNGIAGFELDSKIYLNSVLPEFAAKQLKEIL